MIHNIKKFISLLAYRFSERRNFYLYKAVGQRQNTNGETIIIYTLLGKRDLYEINIKDLIDDHNLLEQFHPFQAVKFGSIAIGDLLFSLPPDQRENRYNYIRDQMLEPNENEEMVEKFVTE